MTGDSSQQEQHLFQRFFATSLLPIFIKDSQGRYAVVSDRFERTLQRSRAEILGKTDVELFPADVAAKLQSNDHQILASGQPAVFQESSVLADGTHTYQTIKFPISDEQGTVIGIGGIAFDTTGQG